MPDIILDGCRPKPLASYLKAIGILRILSEQKDPQATGFWLGESFVLNTSLSLNELADFFCNEYAPTPIVSPWNGGSGFYAGDAVDGINAISNFEHERFNAYRKIISEVQSWPEIPSFRTIRDVLGVLNEQLATGPPTGKAKLVGLLNEFNEQTKSLSDILGQDILQLSMGEVESAVNRKDLPDLSGRKKWWNAFKKARTKATELKRSEGKERILPICRSRLPDSSVKWIDAVCAIQNDGAGTFSPLLGTGGNEGRFEFSNNFMQRLNELFIKGYPSKTYDLFCSAVTNINVSGLISASIGQYDPGRAGGYNQGMEIETKDFKINPWDFVLAIEGSLVMASAIVRRNPTEDRAWLTVPFSVNFSAVGFSSSAFNETGRREVWIPIWRNPAPYPEIKQLFSEGRASLGKRQAENGIEFSRAIGTLGVDRGIESFQRYAFLMRRGKSYVALPAGRIKTLYQPKLEVLNELDPITKTIKGFLRAFKNVPASFGSASQNIEEAVFKCTLDPSASNFLDLVRSLGRIAQMIGRRDRAKDPSLSRPLSGLSPKWIDYSDDGGVEVRVAAALASIRGTGRVGPMRSNMLEVDPAMPWRWSVGRADQYWYGNNLSRRVGGVLSRRIMDAVRRSGKRFPAEAHLPIPCQDVMPFLWKLTDDEKIEDLLWGFCLIDWRKTGLLELSRRWKLSVSEQPIARSYCVLKLLHSPHKIKDIVVRMEPRIINLLSAGRIEKACALAVQRLKASRLSPHMIEYDKDVDTVRLTAAMLVPIRDQWKLEALVLKDKQ